MDLMDSSQDLIFPDTYEKKFPASAQAKDYCAQEVEAEEATSLAGSGYELN